MGQSIYFTEDELYLIRRVVSDLDAQDCISDGVPEEIKLIHSVDDKLSKAINKERLKK